MGLAQSVASQIADPDVRSSIPIWPHTFVEIDYKTFPMEIFLLPLIREELLSVTSENMHTEYWLFA